MALSLSLKVTDDLTLTFAIHGMEPELPTDLVDVEGMLPDPRYPDLELQLEHHKQINQCSKRARGLFWGCEDLGVILYHLNISDDIGSHLENTGRKFWTQSGVYSHSYCEHILQDPGAHNIKVFLQKGNA